MLLAWVLRRKGPAGCRDLRLAWRWLWPSPANPNPAEGQSVLREERLAAAGLLHGGAGAPWHVRAELGDQQAWRFKWTFWLQCCLQPSAPLLRGCGWSASAEKFLAQVRSQCPLAGRPSLGSPRTWPPQAGGQVGVQSHTETLGFAHLINVIVETICQIFYRRVGPPFHGILWGVGWEGWGEAEGKWWLACLKTNKQNFLKRIVKPE